MTTFKPASQVAADVIAAASRITGIEPGEILGFSRVPHVARTRFAIFLTLCVKGWPCDRIAKLFRSRHNSHIDPSTVFYGLRRAAGLVDSSPDFRDLCRALKLS